MDEADLTTELKERILQAVREAADFGAASTAAGVPMETIYDWMNRGLREGSGIYREFSDEMWKLNNDPELLKVARDRTWENEKSEIETTHDGLINEARQRGDMGMAWALKRTLAFLRASHRAVDEQTEVDVPRSTFNFFLDLNILSDPHQPQHRWIKAAQLILKQAIRRPIHRARWQFVKDELQRLAELHRRSKKTERDEHFIGALFDAADRVVQEGREHAGNFTAQIGEDKHAVWSLLNDILTEDLAGPGWREKEQPRKRKSPSKEGPEFTASPAPPRRPATDNIPDHTGPRGVHTPS
jgi:hypothetical protein